MTKPYIIGCDVDDVLANLIGEWVRRYNKKYNDTLVPEMITKWEIEEFVKPECGKNIFALLDDPDLYDHVLPFHGARESIERLREIGRVVFITAGNGTQKLRWLKQWGFLPKTRDAERDFFMAKDKALVNADILMDDCIANVEAFPREAILIAQGHNADYRGVRRRLSLSDAVAWANWKKWRSHPAPLTPAIGGTSAR